MTRAIINEKRKEGIREKYRILYGMDAFPNEEIPPVEDEFILLELSPEMEAALDHINQDQANTLWLHYVAELTTQDIADLQRVKLGTVLSRLHRGREALRNRLDTERKKGVN
jgi:RNA polymerase sigma factor (sigma-70 family)